MNDFLLIILLVLAHSNNLMNTILRFRHFRFDNSADYLLFKNFLFFFVVQQSGIPKVYVLFDCVCCLWVTKRVCACHWSGRCRALPVRGRRCTHRDQLCTELADMLGFTQIYDTVTTHWYVIN